MSRHVLYFDRERVQLNVIDRKENIAVAYLRLNISLVGNYLKPHVWQMHGRETITEMMARLMGLDAVMDATIVFLCAVALLLRVSDNLL